MTTTADPILLEAQAYVKDLTEKIAAAKRRIAITSLIFTDDDSTDRLIIALKQAAKRGVAVDILADSFTFSEFGGFFNPFKKHTKRSRYALRNARSLKQSGISFTWLDDRLKLNPFAGVTHIKWSVVDTTCYVFGGVNLYTGGIAQSTDYMIRLDDSLLADALVKQQIAIAASPTPLYPGYTGTSKIGTWHIDSGKQNDSIIYDRACELAKKATHILFVSQYAPSGPLAKILKYATADVYYNQPKTTSFPTNLMLWRDQLASGIQSQYTRKKYLHAKFIIFTMPDGKKIALTGSHNFSHKGVVFGTREIALETQNPAVVLQLEKFYNTYVA